MNNLGALATNTTVNTAVNLGDIPDTQPSSGIRPMNVFWELNEINGSDVVEASCRLTLTFGSSTQKRHGREHKVADMAVRCGIMR